MILLAILCRFVLIVDRMHRNPVPVRKIVVSMQIFRDFCRLIDRLRQFEQNFAVYLTVEKQHGHTHCNFLYWLQNSDYFTNIYRSAKLKWSHF